MSQKSGLMQQSPLLAANDDEETSTIMPLTRYDYGKAKFRDVTETQKLWHWNSLRVQQKIIKPNKILIITCCISLIDEKQNRFSSYWQLYSEFYIENSKIPLTNFVFKQLPNRGIKSSILHFTNQTKWLIFLSFSKKNCIWTNSLIFRIFLFIGLCTIMIFFFAVVRANCLFFFFEWPFLCTNLYL